METPDRILLELLMLAIAAFPVAVFLYLRTAYRKGGWPQVKMAPIVAVVAMLIPLGLRIWFDWGFSNLQRIIEHPFALGSILFVVLMWVGHRVVKARIGETHDHH
jgi:hypothetical protein